MGEGYGAICNECGTSFEVNDGVGMTAIPLHCDRYGKEWWWEFTSKIPLGETPHPPTCECGGTFRSDAPARCPSCRSTDFRRDTTQPTILYD